MLPEQVELLTSLDLEGAQVVLVGIVLVDLVLTESGIAVAFPSTTEIHLVVDASDAVATAYHEAECIVLSIASVGYLQLSQDRREEGTRSAQTVDAQSIVAPILERPLAMVDEARRKGVQLEVAHTVRAYYHRSTFSIEGIHHSLQCLWRGVEVVAVELHHEASHQRMMYSRIPAATDAQVVALRYNVNDAFVGRELVDGFRCAVCRAVINYDEVEWEGRFLFQDTTNGVANGSLAVANGNDDGSLHSKFAFREVHFVVLVAMQVSVQGAKMPRASPFHFHLTAAVAGVNIVELLLSAQPRVVLHLSIKELVDVQRQLLAADAEAEVVEGSELIVMQVFLSDVFLQHFCAE